MWLDGFRTGWTDTRVGVKLCIFCCLPPTQSNFHKQHRGQTSEKKGGGIIRSRGTSGKGDCGEKQLKAETKNYWEGKTKSELRMKEQIGLIDVLFWLRSRRAEALTLKSFWGNKAALPVRTRNHLPSDAGDGWQRDRNIHDLWPSTRHLLLYWEQALFSGCSWCHGWLHSVTLTFVCQLTIKPTVEGQN